MDTSIRNQACTQTYTYMYYRNTTSTHWHTHTLHTPSSCDDEECEAWLSLASPLSDLYLNDNNLTLSPGVFSGLSSLRSLVCLRESEREWVSECVSLSHTWTRLSFLRFSCIAYFIRCHFLWVKHRRIFVSLMCAHTQKKFVCKGTSAIYPFSWYLIYLPLFLIVCIFVLPIVYTHTYIYIWNCRRVTCMYLTCVYLHRVHFFFCLMYRRTHSGMYTHRQTDEVAKQYKHTLSRTLTLAPVHTLELWCRRVWELTFPCSIFQSASSLQQPTRDFCIPRIFGAAFAQVACVCERVRLCECVLFFKHVSQIFFFAVCIGAELCLTNVWDTWKHVSINVRVQYTLSMIFHIRVFVFVCHCARVCVLFMHTHTNKQISCFVTYIY